MAIVCTNLCVRCDKEKAILRCGRCSQDFCYNHFVNHRQELNEQMEEIEVIRQTLTEQSAEPRKHALIKQVDKWERDSINKIRQTADKARQLLLPNISLKNKFN